MRDKHMKAASTKSSIDTEKADILNNAMMKKAADDLLTVARSDG